MLRKLIDKYSHEDLQPTREEMLEDLQTMLSRVINKGTFAALRDGSGIFREPDGSFVVKVKDPTEYAVRVSPVNEDGHDGMKFEMIN